MSHSVILALVAVTVLATPGAATAERVGLVVRLPAASPTTQVELARTLTRAGQRAGDEVVSAPFRQARRALARGAVRAERLKGFSRVARLLGEGRRGYSAADLPFALARFSEARQRALAVADLPGGRALVAEASLLLGVTRIDLNAEGGLEDLRLAATLAPERRVTTAEFKPAVVEAFGRAGQSRTTVAVRIVGPRGATLELDGATGRIPWRGALEVGLHLLVVRQPGMVPRAMLVRVEEQAKAPQTIDVELEAAAERQALLEGRDSLALGTGEKQARVAASALSTFAALDAVVIASAVWRRGSPAVIAEWCEGEPLVCRRTVEVRYPRRSQLPAAAREAWKRARAAEGALAPGVLADARVVTAEGPPGAAVVTTEGHWATSPYLWAAVGTGVAAAIVTAIVLSGDDGRRPEVIIGDDFLPR